MPVWYYSSFFVPLDNSTDYHEQEIELSV